MKAAVIHEYGGPEVLRHEDFPDPVAGEGQILVRVAATSVNPIDLKRRSGAAKAIYPIDFPGVLGLDVSGTVLRVGLGVSGFSVGEPVLTMGWPSYAELCSVEASGLAKLPVGLDLVDAAVLPTVATTGHTLISLAAGVRAGQRVLITGAVGMVGRCAMFTAKSLGAHVIAAVRSKDVGEAIRLGADEGVDTEDASAIDRLRDLDVVADTVGGQLAEALFPKIKAGGVYATVQLPTDVASRYPAVKTAYVRTAANAEMLLEMAIAFRDGKLEIPIGLRVPLSQAAKAHEAVENHTANGKVLVVMSGEV